LRGREYDQAVDMWSLGVIIYILLGGYPPFQDENQTKLFRKIRQGSYKFHDEYWKDISADAKDLIRSMLTVDPSRRITAAGAMQHAWLTTDRADNLPVFNLEKNLHQFKLFNAQRKLRGAIQTVIMLDRLAEMSNSKW
jgi:serine/threonine protein kinase